ncbi:MAG: serine/threonine protein kinase [Planctomycetaceae bacterium]|nr:serine/threonine protein kinase [Planctomycetaceae bacterium]
MSGPGLPISHGSSEQGLTFVRPLPAKVRSAPSEPLPGDSQTVSPIPLMDRLFPPRSLDDSGSVPPVTGVELGHFVIEERIGRGGMGAVFRALDCRLNRVVALKVLSPEHSQDPEAVIRFQNEARAAARLDHDNISRVFFIGEQSGLHFIAFEFVSGTNIRNFILQKGRLAPTDAINYTLQVAEALRHTAAAAVVHRDIKPSNIIVSPTGRAKLVDLGLARYTAADASRDLTVDGAALGTFDYIAPEQALNARNVDVRADIYSLGCTLYHMLTGEPPYPKGGMFEKVENHRKSLPPDPAMKNSLVSPQLSRVTQKMMASNPDERYSSPEVLIADLMLIAESLGLEPTYPETVVWNTPLFSRKSSRWEGARTWGALATVLLMLALIAGRMEQGTNTFPLTLGESRERAPETVGRTVPRYPEEAPHSDPLPIEGSESQTGDGLPADDSQIQSAVALEASRQKAFNDGMRKSMELLQEMLLPAASTFSSTAANPGFVAASNPESGLMTEPPSLSPKTESGTDRPTMTNSNTPTPTRDSQNESQTVAVSAEPFVVLVPGSDERIHYATLAEACATAPDNSVIEIQTSGPHPIRLDEVKIVNKRVRIRPAPNLRPLLRCVGDSRSASGTYSRTVELFHVDRGAIELYDIDVELVVDPDSVSDLWSLVTLHSGSELLARGVSLTISNPSLMPATLISVPQNDLVGLDALMPDRMMARNSLVVLSESFCRGQMDFVLQKRLSSVDYRLDNVAMAITGTMFRIDGSEAFSTNMDSNSNELTSIQLAHVTSVTGEGLIRASSGDHGLLPRLEVDLSDNVFRMSPRSNPVIVVKGQSDSELLLDNLALSQRRDPSFYNASGPFCVIESATSRFLEPEEYGLEDFGILASSFVEDDLLQFDRSMESTPMNQVQTADLMLRDEESFINPAMDASSDLQDAGVDWSLPRLPIQGNQIETAE